MSSSSNLSNKIDDTSLNMIKPMNVILCMVFYSPIILISLLTFLSFVFQNFKGLIYLGFVLAASVLRYFLYYISGSSSELNNNSIPLLCKSMMYTQYGNTSFSIFIFSFTIAYLFLPMFINGYANYWIFSLLLFYSLLDFFVKFKYNCIKSITDSLLNLVFGLFMGILFIVSMYSGGSQDFLFFNEMNTGVNTCSKPKNQQFKCKVYKNGELIGSTTSM